MEKSSVYLNNCYVKIR